ncbi:response regulator [Demequina soli]|uniref:response regulator n=1 Tax=Demequina soli TaxID=1638987 RepID=UPI000784F482|nr:response regulator transcription factor [Demequina soli]
MTESPIRVLIADDHPVVRGGLAALLRTLPGIEVVAEAADGAGAVREALLTRPDVVILDLRMPVLDGVGAARRITADVPSAGVLVLTMFDEDALIAEALAAGARGYLLKGAEPEEIERAVRAVAAGAAILSPQVAARVLGRASTPQPAQAFPHLTSREHEVLDLIARGLANHAIADRLGIAAKTVGNHVSAIFAKTGVATRAEAIVLARDGGLGA